ncbi:MAG: hypothetical protein C0478_13830 [Planctomyces sp.]|nr:hypothetical protein [Planctomyces sp.]
MANRKMRHASWEDMDDLWNKSVQSEKDARACRATSDQGISLVPLRTAEDGLVARGRIGAGNDG